MENNIGNIIKISLLSIIAIALIWIIVLLMNKDFKFGINASNAAKLVLDETYKEEIKNIKIESISTDVKIKEGETDEINVKIYEADDKDVSVEVNKDTLNIIDKKKHVGFFIINNNARIIITIPKDKEYNLDLKSESSDVTVNANLNDIKMESKSGDMDLKDAKNIDIKVKSGDISIGTVEDLSINTKSGDVTIYEVTKKLKTEVVSGDIKISKVSLSKNSSIKTTSGDIFIGETNDIYTNAKVTSGDIKIGKNNRRADIELTIKTTSGDIRVN